MGRGRSRPHEAAQRTGSLVAALDALAGDMPPEHRQGYEVQVRKLERDLGSEVFARETALGQTLQWTAGLDLAIATAEAVAEPSAPFVSTARASDDPLTTREREVVALLAEGLGNKAIATELGITAKKIGRAHV